MFQNCTSLKKLNLSNFDTVNVDKMNKCFYNCKALIDLDISKFFIKQDAETTSMFDECNKELKQYLFLPNKGIFFNL